jgi:hypothetical protein
MTPLKGPTVKGEADLATDLKVLIFWTLERRALVLAPGPFKSSLVDWARSFLLSDAYRASCAVTLTCRIGGCLVPLELRT